MVVDGRRFSAEQFDYLQDAIGDATRWATKQLTICDIAVDDELLEIHDKQGGVRAVDGKRLGHNVIRRWDWMGDQG
jgi:hypothetical protein